MLQVEDAEFVRAKGLTITTDLDCSPHWLTTAESCLDDENELPLKVIDSFSASGFALPSILLMVLHILVTSVFWSKVSKISQFLPFVCVDAVLDVII